jgi:hypothetical protein
MDATATLALCRLLVIKFNLAMKSKDYKYLVIPQVLRLEGCPC